MITQARFTNYKLLRSVEIPLARLNVIVGANGVGKSSVLEGLETLLEVPNEQDRSGDGARVFLRERTTAALPPGATDLQLEVTTDQGLRFGVSAQVLSDHTRFRAWFGKDAVDLSPGAPPHVLGNARSAGLGSVMRLRLDATALAEPHYSEKASPRIEYDGTGLASVLQYLQGARDEAVERIEKDLAMIVPGARRIRSLPARISRPEKVRIAINGQESWVEQTREVTGARFEVEWDGAGWIPSQHLSEGTLLALGLITVLRLHPPRVVLLDDIDKALHPVAQRSVVRLLKQILDHDPELQIVATAHSPFVLDALDPAEVLIAGMVAPGRSQIRPLTDHPSWAKRADYLKPGEFWSAVGEGWVAENKV